MNAHTPILTPPILTPMAVSRADVLRHLRLCPGQAAADIAKATGRDRSNTRRDLAKLADQGLVTEDNQLTPAGLAAIAALERAEGRAEGRAAAEPAEGPSAPSEAPATAPAGFAQLILQQIEPDPLNPRKHFDPEAIDELADSIARDGLLENLVVRPGRIEPFLTAPVHRLVAGERRWRAIKRLVDRGEWPRDRPIMCKVVDIDDAAHRRIALVENLQRKDLRPIDEAQALKELMELEKIGTAEIAKEIGFTQRFVQQRIQLLELPPIKQVELQEGRITIEDARRALARMREEEEFRKARLLEPDELLAFAEVAHAIHHRPEQIEGWYYGAPTVAIGYRALEEGETIARLVARGALEVTEGFRADPRVFARIGYRITAKDLEAQLPGVLGKDGRRVLNVQRRRVLGEAEANRIDATWAPSFEGPGEYATWALNAPFTETIRDDLAAAAAAFVERERQRAAEDFNRKCQEQAAAEARRAREAEIAAEKGEPGKALLARVRAFEAEAAELPPPTFNARFAELLADIGLEGPFTLNWSDDFKLPVLFTASGKVMFAAAYVLEAHRRLIVMAMNFAQGMAIYSGPDFAAPYNTPEPAAGNAAEALPREEFLRAVVDYLMEEAEDLPDDEDQALALVEIQADVGLTEFLEREAIAYGDPRYDWNDEGAEALARAILKRDQESELDADDEDLPDAVKALATGQATPIAGEEVEP